MGRVGIAIVLGAMLAACSIQVLPVPVGGLAGGPSGSSSGGGGSSSIDSGAPADAGARDAADAGAE